MTDTVHSERVGAMLDRLGGAAVDHPHFRGPPPDISDWTALELGQVWAALHRAEQFGHDDVNARSVAHQVLEQAKRLGLAPQFDDAGLLAALRAARGHEWDYAIACLACLNGPAQAEAGADLGVEALRLLGAPDGASKSSYQAYLLARLAGPGAASLLADFFRQRHPNEPYLLQELALLPQLTDASLLALAGSRYSGHWNRDCIGDADPAQALAMDAAYIDFSRSALEAAARQLSDIHAGKVAYVADGAFSTSEAQVLARAARVAAYRDEAWFGPVITTLLPLASLAPGPTVKSAPSQSLAMALGNAVETVPTPESLLALRTTYDTVRHAGIKKRLVRHLKPAQRALAERPDIALRLGVSLDGGKRERATVLRGLEAGYLFAAQYAQHDWRRVLAASHDGRQLIWCANSIDNAGCAAFSFMLDGATPVDSNGQPLALPAEATISLWHPLYEASAQRAAWQAYLSARAIRQPLRQAYRETYGFDVGMDAFAGHVLAVRPLLGLARGEGWRLDYDCLRRQFGDLRLTLGLSEDLYPGAGGHCESRAMVCQRRHGSQWQAVTNDELAPVLWSEMCRAVDLLVSVSAFALGGEADAHDPQRWQRLAHLDSLDVGAMAAMRRAVLRQVFAPQIAAGRLAIGERHAHVGAHALHLATGRVTVDGAPVALALPQGGARLAALPWLPYDEVLLEKLAAAIGVLLSGSPSV